MGSSSSDATAQVEECDVFLSFRGKDTRNNIISFLHGALDRRGIEVFNDDELVRGDEISLSLLKAIEKSKISIIVFSKGYASSRWCLEELVKILDCKNKFDQNVIPIFYHIDPSQVRHQTGQFEEAFARHEARFKDKVPIWRKALTEAANLSGVHFDDTKPESPLLEKFANDVLVRLNRVSPSENKDLVGIESRIARIESLLCIGSSKDVCIIVGIWGLGGIGKTTLAYEIFNKIKTQFKSSHFLDVEKEPTFSKDSLPRKKVLIVFDNVTSAQQIEKFARDLKCFGSGSRVIITARDKQLLLNCGVNDRNIYEVEELYFDQALQLFSQHAFKQNSPKAEYMELAKKIVKYSKGLPLALKVLGSCLLGKEKEHWKIQINKLEKCPHQDILKVLQPSYDQLDSQQKSIFLDVACFFNQAEYDDVIDILEACGFSPKLDIPALIDKCLILSREDRRNRMHDLLQEMGGEITRQEFKDPGKRSRLWHHNDIYHMLTRNTGTETVEGIRLDMSKIPSIDLNPCAFAKMQGLRIFDFCCSHAPLEFGWTIFNYHKCNKENYNKVHASQGLKFASNNLAYFRWEGYPLESLPSGFHPNNLVALVMPHNQVKKLWTGIQHLDNLKHINLSYSEHLTEIPDLSLAPKLESLILEGCTSLTKISSIQYLDKLATLDLTDCKSLSHFPSSIHSRSLSIVVLSGCSNLCTTPIFSCVEQLYLTGTSISEFPLIEDPSRLFKLYLSQCSRLENLPSSIRKLHGLECLYLSGCSKLERLSELANLKELIELEVKEDSIRELPEWITRLNKLVLLSVMYCELTKLPDSFDQLTSLQYLYLDGNNFEKIPAVIKNLLQLSFLGLSSCKRLQSLQELQGDGELEIDLYDCIALEDISDLSWSWIYKINFANCFKLDENTLRNKMKDDLRYQQGFHRTHGGSICFPGNEIPEWFDFQTIGSSMKIKVPPDWFNENIRFALCAIVGFPDHKASPRLEVYCYWYTKSKHGGGTQRHYFKFSPWSYLYSNEYYLAMLQDHVFLGLNFKEDIEDVYDECVDLSEDSEAYIKFEIHCFGKCNYEVKKCGVHLVYGHDSGKPMEEQIKKSSRSLNADKEEKEEPYSNYKNTCWLQVHPPYEKEVEEFNTCTNKSSNLSSLDLHEFPQDFVGTTMDATTTKLSLAAYDGAEPPSRSGCCDGQPSSCSLLDLNELAQDLVGSTKDVIAPTKRSWPEPSGNVCDEDEPQHKSVKAYKFF